MYDYPGYSLDVNQSDYFEIWLLLYRAVPDLRFSTPAGSGYPVLNYPVIWPDIRLNNYLTNYPIISHQEQVLLILN